MLMPIRRIVTENSPEGRSRILSDGPNPHVLETAPERGLTNFWVCRSGSPDMSVPDGADRPIVLAPETGSTIFRYFQLPPASDDTAGESSQTQAEKVFEAMGAIKNRVADAKHPSMHRTVSLDFIILLQGRVRLILDDEETILNPFDVVIQRETNHAWQNISSEPALLMAVLMDCSGSSVDTNQ